jgi:hypothetical protein
MDADAGEMEPIRVPADADRGSAETRAVRVVDERRREPLEAVVVEVRRTVVAQRPAERRARESRAPESNDRSPVALSWRSPKQKTSDSIARRDSGCEARGRFAATHRQWSSP